MSKRMLIDATHKEETRVVVADDNRLIEYEYESTLRQQLRGNIFLAKVTRVEPSLQAAFVNFGGNRHGFLPFTEIHPDYYRIPIADREALLAEQREQLERARREEEEEDEAMEAENGSDDDEKPSDTNIEETDDGEEEPEELGGGSESGDDPKSEAVEDDADGNVADTSEEDTDGNDKQGQRHNNRGGRNRGRGRGRGGRGGRASHRSKRVEMVGGDIVDGDQPIRPNLSRRYKIQEVVKRGQIMLVQVSKEERGNKGAAVTTYLSLPGRYCVLMPNSPRSGGVSRKIANYKDRKRLREILKEFKVPDGMSVIVRTAGVARTKTEIKRDLDYLMRLWDTIRSTTLESQAPALIYEEGELVKRAIRDIYDRDTEEVVVEGEDGYKRARDIMKMMIPSHVKRVKEHKGEEGSLFQAYQLEDQITSIGEMTVQLKSGGYLVIQQTEALVSIDVNSGRATKERHIEETALRTNLEAAVEVARQLRLRDLGGLVVIDFIDMEDRRNNGKVERKLKDALSTDRARLQVGRISSFGLLELSRQRISASLNETQFQKCPHCEGAGAVRTVDSLAIIVLRALESLGMEDKAAEVSVTVTPNVALYLLNRKRPRLVNLEERYGLKITVDPSEDISPSEYELDVQKTKRELAAEAGDEDAEVAQAQEEEDNNADSNNRRDRRNGKDTRRSRRGGRGRRKDADTDEDQPSDHTSSEGSVAETSAGQEESGDKDEQPANKRRRNAPSKSKSSRFKADKEGDKEDADVKAEEVKEDAPKKKPTRSRKKKDEADSAAPADTEEAKEDKPVKKTAKKSPAKKKAAEPSNDVGEPEAEKKEKAEPPAQTHAREQEVVNEPPKSKKKGWWNRSS